MDFYWNELKEKDYENKMKYINDCLENGKMVSKNIVGLVRIGELLVEVTFIEESLDVQGKIEDGFWLNLYVANENTGYSDPDAPIPYDYADGETIVFNPDMTYENFKNEFENKISKYIEKYDTDYTYSLMEHASKPLLIW